MKRIFAAIGIFMCAVIACAGSTIIIPLTQGLDISNSCTMTESTDDPGSSTVDPIDPNQAKAELTGNTLKVYEGLEGDAQISVYNMTNPQVVLQTSFDESVTLTLTDTARYSIQLYHPSIGIVYGTFRFPVDDARKIMLNGKMYILLDHHSYSSSGMKIQ